MQTLPDIECRTCRTMNDGEEHRCVRCGRRLHVAAAQAAAGAYSVVSSSGAAAATAPAFETYPGGVPLAEPAEPERADYQPSLFREAHGSPKVIPIPTLTPLRPSAREAGHTARRVSPRPGSLRHSPNRQSPSRHRTSSGSQQALDLQVADPTTSRRESELAPSTRHHGELIFADVPVALPTHRMLAAAVDASIVLVAVGVFLGLYISLTVLVGAGSDVVIDRQTLPFLGIATVIIALFYRLLWCLADGDSPGMRFAGLRLVDFDGRPPGRERRFIRQAASLLSLAACGLGLVWALVDEESLTWHDHISKTFPTAG